MSDTRDGVLGSYAFGGNTGIVLASFDADAVIFHFRFPKTSGGVTTEICAIKRITFAVQLSTVASGGTPDACFWHLHKATGWTTSTTGDASATDVALASTCKVLNKDASAVVGDNDSLLASTGIRLGTGAAVTGIVAPTYVIEANPLAVYTAPASPAFQTPIGPHYPLLQPEQGEKYALKLRGDEGFIIRNKIDNAAMRWRAFMNVTWDELSGPDA